MRNFILLLIGTAAAFMGGRTYERAQQQPIIAAKIIEARQSAARAATPPKPSAAWMNDPARHTALDEPAKSVGVHGR